MKGSLRLFIKKTKLRYQRLNFGSLRFNIINNASFKYHVKLTLFKVSRALFILYIVKKILIANALKSLYYLLIHSLLIYASPIWSLCNQ
jgi:hypothetical protein